MIDLKARRSPQLIAELRQQIEVLCQNEAIQAFSRPLVIMEVCGTHTASIYHYGIKSILPKQIKLVSGPGCPVCVTTNDILEKAMAVACRPEVIFTSFGDMMRVPAASGSLLQRKSEGADIRIVYSPLDALKIAKENPSKQVVFFGIGFETTAPTTAAAIEKAAGEGMTNFSVLSVHKTMPEALRLLLPDAKVDGLLCPGHVAAITGAAAFEFVASELGKASAVAGFEPADIMEAIIAILQSIISGKPALVNSYPRFVKTEANSYAIAAMNRVFAPCNAVWRGLGNIPNSGLALREEFAAFDALKRFPEVSQVTGADNPACCCGSVLRGELDPGDCPLMGKVCTPESPAGACMVSGEGACSAFYKYRGLR